MRIIVWGAKGRMGQLVCQIISASSHELVGQVDRHPTSLPAADMIIDFSTASGTEQLLDYATNHHIPVVIATTGQSSEQLLAIERASQLIPILQSANMSVGMNLLYLLVAQVAQLLDASDVEIVETHHRRKVDAPSGSALNLAQVVQQARGSRQLTHGRKGASPRTPGEIGIHSVRGGDIVGEHAIHFFAQGETITLTHTAQNPELFAHGALRAADFIRRMPAGHYTMQDVLNFGLERCLRNLADSTIDSQGV